MKHFRKEKNRVDVFPFLKELEMYPGKWGTFRGKTIACQRETISIFLRKALITSKGPVNDTEKSIETDSWKYFPILTSFIQEFAKEKKSEVCRVLIANLKPLGTVYKHRDTGAYYATRDRYHLVLQSPAGSRMRVENEEILWKEGELWWFDNKSLHEAFNDSTDTERIHVIFDLQPKRNWLKYISWKKILKIGRVLPTPSSFNG